MRSDAMKDEYDFSKGQRGKFYTEGAQLNLPVYLDADVLSFVERIARKRRCDVSTVVNELLKSDMELARHLE